MPPKDHAGLTIKNDNQKRERQSIAVDEVTDIDCVPKDFDHTEQHRCQQSAPDASEASKHDDGQRLVTGNSAPLSGSTRLFSRATRTPAIAARAEPYKEIEITNVLDVDPEGTGHRRVGNGLPAMRHRCGC